MSNVKLAVIYYSMGGTNYQQVKWFEERAKEAEAEVRLAKVQEMATESVIAGNDIWKSHVDATKDVLIATSDDL